MHEAVPPYFHVLASFAGSEIQYLMGDLSEAAMTRNFIKPYNAGRKILIDGRVTDLSTVTTVRLIRTEATKAQTLEKIQAESQAEIDRINSDPQSSMLIVTLGSGWADVEVATDGADVTPEYIDGPPGVAPWWKLVMNHPWITAIATAIFAGLILAFASGIGAPTPG